jgi:DNA-binding transcriptional ArsR family regulator
MTQAECAKILGISRSYASELEADPDGSVARARKDSYGLPCPECGGPMTGSNGRNVQSGRCHKCQKIVEHEDRKWTRETMIAAFREFYRLTGRTPTASDRGSPAILAKASPERREEIAQSRHIPMPSPRAVKDEFGSWRAAVLESGLDIALTGSAGARSRRHGSVQVEVLAALVEGPLSTAEIKARCRDGSQTSITCALRSLRDEGLIERGEPAGKGFIYRLVHESVANERWRTMMPTEWVVLRKTGEGKFEEVGTSDAPTRDLAVERVAKEEGEYRCVKLRDFEPFPVEPEVRMTVKRPSPRA